jgi:methionyl-tRNA formyltransferase
MTTLAFLGNHAWSVASLQALAGEPSLEVGLVVTNPPAPAGRGSELRPTPVAVAAADLGIEVLEAADLAPSSPASLSLADAAPDLLVVVAYGHLLAPAIIETAPLGALNLHLSLLPRWRGAAPVQHAIAAGDAVTGVTVMRLDAGLDTGPILAQLEDRIRPDDDAGTLGARLASMGAALLRGVVLRIGDPALVERAQDDARATVAPVPAKADREIAWTEPAAVIARKIRAFAPAPGAATSFRGARLKLLVAAASGDGVDGTTAGQIVAADERGVVVATGSGALRLLQVAPAGRTAMPAADWARGARFTPGERLG